MIIIHSEYQSFTLPFGINVFRDFTQHCLIKWASNDLPVEGFYIELNFIFQFTAVEQFTGDRVNHGNLFTSAIPNALGTEFADNVVRSIMIDKISVNDCLAVTVVENRITEDCCGMQRRCRSQGDFYGIEILNHHTILANIICFITIEHFCFGKLFIHRISPMRLIDND